MFEDVSIPNSHRELLFSLFHPEDDPESVSVNEAPHGVCQGRCLLPPPGDDSGLRSSQPWRRAVWGRRREQGEGGRAAARVWTVGVCWFSVPSTPSGRSWQSSSPSEVPERNLVFQFFVAEHWVQPWGAEAAGGVVRAPRPLRQVRATCRLELLGPKLAGSCAHT